jgi:hypothetical protein
MYKNKKVALVPKISMLYEQHLVEALMAKLNWLFQAKLLGQRCIDFSREFLMTTFKIEKNTKKLKNWS